MKSTFDTTLFGFSKESDIKTDNEFGFTLNPLSLHMRFSFLNQEMCGSYMLVMYYITKTILFILVIYRIMNLDFNC